MSRRAVAVVLVALAAALAGAAPAAALVIGIGDQKPTMFTDARFKSLQIRFARYTVAWDALESPWQVQELDAWLSAARQDGVQPLISFSHSREPATLKSLPSVSRFKYEFRKFRARYPWVTTFATWNEANHCSEPVCHRPGLVAEYWRAISRECPTCTILGAEVLDAVRMTQWVRAFIHQAGRQPRYWGLHNYVDANRLRTSGTRAMLRAVKGQIWLTETGGIVARRHIVPSTITFPESVHHAAQALSWVFRRIVPLSTRITRVYIYQWDASSTHDTWDSALIDPHGRIRQGFIVVSKAIRAVLERARKREQSLAAATIHAVR